MSLVSKAMTIYDKQLNDLSGYSLPVLREAVLEASDITYVSKLRGLKKCPYCKYVFPQDDNVNHCKC